MADIINLPENLTIHTINDSYAELSQKVQETGDEIIFDAGAVETIDTSGLQSLLMLIRMAESNQHSISWQNTNELFMTSANNIGLTEALKLA